MKTLVAKLIGLGLSGAATPWKVVWRGGAFEGLTEGLEEEVVCCRDVCLQGCSHPAALLTAQTGRCFGEAAYEAEHTFLEKPKLEALSLPFTNYYLYKTAPPGLCHFRGITGLAILIGVSSVEGTSLYCN